MTTATFVEQDCTVRHAGRSFTAGGAFASPDYLIAYPGESVRLNDWHGNQIGTYLVQSSRPAVFFGRRSWMGDKFYTMRATVNGRTYLLRGFGKGMIAKGRAVK